MQKPNFINGRTEVYCEFKKSEKCKQKWTVNIPSFYENKKKNNGHIICYPCAVKSKMTGSNNPASKKRIDETYFDKIDTEEKAYLLGWIASDGCIEKKNFRIHINEKDEEIIHKLKNIFSIDIPIERRPSKKLVGFKINSVKITQKLLQHLKLKKYGKKSFDIVLPDLEKYLLPHFIRGYLDGDGSIPRSKIGYPQCYICSSSISIIEHINILFNNNGKISKSISTLGNKEIYYLRFNGEQALEFLNTIYKDSTIKLQRKYDNYLSIKDWKNKRNGPRNISKLR